MSLQNDVPALLADLMARAPAGFAIGLHVRFQAPTYMFQTYPVAWLEEYSHKGLMMQDPTVAWGMANRGVIGWEALRQRDPAGLFDLARRHGLVHGFAVSLESRGSHSLGGFARTDRAFLPAEIEAIHGLVADLHDRTAETTSLPEATRSALRSLSVVYTQP